MSSLLTVAKKYYNISWWWRDQWPLELAEEASCATYSSCPPHILELCHCLRPMDWDTAIVQSGRRSFYSCNILADSLFGGVVYSLYIPDWTSRGWAMASLHLYLGPGQTHLFAWGGGVIPVIVSSLALGQYCGCHQEWGVIFPTKYLLWL